MAAEAIIAVAITAMVAVSVHLFEKYLKATAMEDILTETLILLRAMTGQ